MRQACRLERGEESAHVGGDGGTLHVVQPLRQNFVDHVDDAVTCGDVGRDDVGTVDRRPPGHPDLERSALEGREHQAVAEICRSEPPGDHVEGEKVGQDGCVLAREECLDRSRAESIKGGIGRGEDGERTVTLQGLDETRRLKRGNERTQVGGGGAQCYDVGVE